MPCCGRKRQALTSSRSSNQAAIDEQAAASGYSRPNIVFRYEGQMAAIFIGAVTGKKYRFRFRGDTQMIDSRDASAMSGEPLLRVIFS
ncbi:hypothetical protein [Thermoflavifilum thermophilum]|uniref:Uncharacterized protein n=1 Tax=Thermoflavifilum thermophilum TaxID=1393122 RepID=A0A1I7NA01_9BACT|nr:hypothetical protein [Thermoflavifilum thermophilum]SFV31502.1 hypothetical protein SAMN05660895_1093 [Thermoflavifilum thermophilum]